MKTTRKALQENVQIDNSKYTSRELETMLNNRETFMPNDNPTYNGNDVRFRNYRLSLHDIKEIKVILDSMRFYSTVAIRNDGKQYYISL